MMRTVEEEPETHYALSSAGPEVSLEELVRVRFTRHRIEEVFEAGKQETGLAHYEVRELGRLAPPRDSVAPGVVVPDPGAASSRGEKPRK